MHADGNVSPCSKVTGPVSLMSHIIFASAGNNHCQMFHYAHNPQYIWKWAHWEKEDKLCHSAFVYRHCCWANILPIKSLSNPKVKSPILIQVCLATMFLYKIPWSAIHIIMFYNVPLQEWYYITTRVLWINHLWKSTAS